MKEHIYTIPLTEALEAGGECPFCTIERRLEEEGVDYALGAAMMEPDFRIRSNERGFCRRHFGQMAQKNSALSLALVLDTHLTEVRSRIAAAAGEESGGRKGLFKKADGHGALRTALDSLSHTCVICDKLNSTLARYAEVFWHLYAREPEFKNRVLQSQGFCVPHFALLLDNMQGELPAGKQQEAVSELCALELAALERINGEVNWFTKKFDYRFHDEPWGNSKDAPQRAMEKLAKYL